jgi:K+-sensing histidine kinase KdpD
MKQNLNCKRWCSNKASGYGIAIFGVLTAFAIRFVLHPFLGGSLHLLFFQINTILVAFFFGIGPALLSLMLSAPLMMYFFMEPFGEFTVLDQRDVSTLLVYFSYTALTGILVEFLRREQYNARIAALVSETRLKLMVEGDQKMRNLIKKSASSPPSGSVTGAN